RIVLVHDNFKRPGFLMMVPFEMSDSKNQRSKAEVMTSRGWVYAPFVMEKFVQPALDPIGDKLSVEIFEDNWEKGSSLFSKVFEEPGYHPMSTQHVEKIGSVEWLIQYSSTSKLQTGVVQLSIVILCLFIIMTGTVAVVIASIHQVAVENKTLAQNLQAKFEEASQITVLGEMTAGIAHEINNPLSIIIGKTQILLSRLEKGGLDMDYLRESLTAIQRTSERTAKIVKGLKALSRRGEADPKATIDLSVIVENSLEISRERFKSHSIDLLVDPVPELTVRCREVQISQVLINLINNAHDAIRGTDNPWVRVSFSQQNDVIDILVLDSGSGIPKEIADKLMTPFFTTKPAGKGTGLGLSISKKIVQDHDGDLFVDHSKVNTCFVIRLPCSTKSALAA
ncbi:MAG TPA: ATP-binding protein, partial [Pseudobdellovibrionaceae bacterium]|nr:ATP-binding protein [Pseudobdellovibrionaceae bacterium]